MDFEGFSEKEITKLNTIGIMNTNDLLFYIPTKYKDYRFPEKGIRFCTDPSEKYLLKLQLTKKPQVSKTSKNRDMAKINVFDGSEYASGIIFAGAWMMKSHKEGDIIYVMAKVDRNGVYIEIKDIELISSTDAGKIIPFYKEKEKVISSSDIRGFIAKSMIESADEAARRLIESIGESENTILEKAGQGFKSIRQIIVALHRPKTSEQVERSAKAVRMITAYHALKLSTSASDESKSDSKSIIRYNIDLVKEVASTIPFNLTKDQKKTIIEISKDLNSPIPMDRLVSGDVGCGKTLTYAVPVVCAHLSGAKVGIISPNSLLAIQIADEIRKTFPRASVRLMISGESKNKEAVNENDIIVGTTAIVSWVKRNGGHHKFDFLVIDEQQKMGTSQKAILTSEHSNVLEATATAIPRTAAAVIYGNKKVSFIEECPYVKNIVTKVYGSDLKRAAFNELLDIVKSGNRIAALYPIRKKTNAIFEFQAENLNDKELYEIQEAINTVATSQPIVKLDQGITSIRYTAQRSQNGDISKQIRRDFKKNDPVFVEIDDPEELEKCKRSVEAAAHHWEKHFPGRVAMIHGGLTSDQKAEALDKAKNGLADVIVTSSVIEIGLTVPGLRGLIVLEAENYGASALHQLRGRCSRNGGDGLFIMMASKQLDEMEQKSLDRLNILVKHNKGSEIAEEDMRQRGFGDLSLNSSKQAGYVNGLFSGVKMTPQDVEELLGSIT